MFYVNILYDAIWQGGFYTPKCIIYKTVKEDN
jgi:hypothetical protein